MFQEYLRARRKNAVSRHISDLTRELIGSPVPPDNMSFTFEYNEDDDMHYIYHNIPIEKLTESQSEMIVRAMVRHLDGNGITNYRFGYKGESANETQKHL